VLTSAFLFAEIAGGLIFKSLALLSDAAHMFTDVAALAIALAAIKIGQRAADDQRTFGYRRFEILAAAFNAILLFGVAIYVLVEGIRRIIEPEAVQSTGMLVVAVIGLVINVISMRVLAGGKNQSLNVKGAYLEVWADIRLKIRRRRPEHDGTFSRGALFHLLKNRVYLGEIVHQGRSFPGNHPAILDIELFEAVQAKLAQQASAHADRPTLAKTAPLKGLLFDADGHPMTPTFTRRGSRLHRYYVSNPLLTGGQLERGDKLRRVAAAELEQRLGHRMAEILGVASASHAFERLLRVELHPRSVAALIRRKSECATAMRQRLQGEEELEQLGDDAVRLYLPIRASFRGGRCWLVGGTSSTIDPILVAALRKARRIAVEHGLIGRGSGEVKSPANPYERKLVMLAFLSPELQRDFLSGRQPRGLKLEDLINDPPPLAWADQPTWLTKIATAQPARNFPVSSLRFP
jgi:hypothetical protein